MSPSAPSFPKRIEDITEGPRIVETFGLGPTLVAVALAAYDVHSLAHPQRAALGAVEIAILAALFAGAVACLAYERHRRTRRAVLVVVESEIGVYRQGLLAGVLSRETLLANRFHEPAMLKGILGLALLAVLFLGYGFTDDGDATSRLVALAPGVWLALLAGSFARSGLLCGSFYLPGSRARALFSTSALDLAGTWRADV
jgi:hypothetical protein